MSIFSRIRKAKKAAADHKKETTQAEESKPPVVPYKHIPTHAAQDALAANPIRWTHEETKARIAEAKQRMSMRVPSTPPTVLHTRANSEHSFPTQPMVRPAHSDLSIVSVMQRPNSDSNSNSNPHFANTKPPVRKYEVPLRLNYNDHNYPAPPEFHAFSTPRDAPMPPLADTRGHLRHRSTASRSSTTRRKSPLSTVSMGQGKPFNALLEQCRVLTWNRSGTHS
ncbi:hypothetical protein B0J11DRAFT_205079 [Dendryphion nanum]|uniref:Uncharacterized protein n=1 Tax=Dendryphion nanum TaxID=256645 RepID=A0A9P9D150_9PLEO|nr:hypothetical protein B0J11DRAFT_205079 [Dendryphion nanum]